MDIGLPVKLIFWKQGLFLQYLLIEHIPHADIRQGAGDTTVNKLDNVLHLKEYSLVEKVLH